MWVLPKPLGDTTGFLCTIIKQNRFFQAIHLFKRGGFFSSEVNRFVIVLRNADRTTICEAQDVDDMMEQWNWIESNKKFSAISDSESDKEAIFQFFADKFRIIYEHVVEEATRSALNLLFKLAFPELTSEEPLIQYPVIFWNGIHMNSGRLFITPRSLCFEKTSEIAETLTSSIQTLWNSWTAVTSGHAAASATPAKPHDNTAPNGAGKAISITARVGATSATSAKVPDGSFVVPFIRVCSISLDGPYQAVSPFRVTTESTEYVFTMMEAREEAYDMAEVLWGTVLDEQTKREEEILRSVASLQLANTPTWDREKDEVPHQPSISYLKAPKEAKIRDPAYVISIRRSKRYQQLFDIPHWEILAGKWEAALILSGEEYNGGFYVSRNFICFHSVSPRSLRLVIPMMEVMEVQWEKKKEILMIKTATQEFWVDIEDERVSLQAYNETHVQWKTAQLSSTSFDRAKLFDELYLRNDAKEEIRQAAEFASTSPRTDRLKPTWQKFFLEQGHGLATIRNDKFEVLIHVGIPDDMRGAIWQMANGALYMRYMMEEHNYYKKLFELNEASSKNSVAALEIERDLNRSFPEHPYYKSSKGIDPLRRVLLAYNWHNPANGYCQSMNIVAALLLLYMNEEAVFYMLCMIADVTLVGSYSRGMLGAMVDQRIFEDYMRLRMPKVILHLEEKSVPLSAITMPWFMTLYIGYLPLRATLRIMDLFFLRGLDALLQAGLAIMRIYEKQILAEEDGYVIATMLKHVNDVDGEEVLRVMINEFHDVVIPDVYHKRIQYRSSVLTDLESNNRSYLYEDLASKTKFKLPELQSMNHQISEATAGAPSMNVDETQFGAFMTAYFEWWAMTSPEQRKLLFTSLIPRSVMRRTINFHEMVVALDPWVNGPLDLRFNLATALFDADKDLSLTYYEASKAIDLLVKSYNKKPQALLKNFVSMIFDKTETNHDGLIAIETIRNLVIKPSSIIEYFGINQQVKTQAAAVAAPNRG